MTEPHAHLTQMIYLCFPIVVPLNFHTLDCSMSFFEPEPSGSIKRKHHFPNENDETSMPALKTQRPNTPSEPLPPPTLTDLDYNCLEKIFVHLDLASLFNVAAANAYLRSTAQHIYKHKFGQRMVCLTAVDNCTSGCSKLCVEDDTIVIAFGWKTSLEFLRSLGASIGLLSIMYRNADSKWSECIDLYLKTYCAQSLTTLVLIERLSSMPWKFAEKPFVNVHTVVIMKSNLTNQLASFPAWFPNLRILDLRDVRMHDRSIEQPFPHLVRLAIDVNNGTRANGFTKREAANFLQLCPALQSLEIRMPFRRQGMTLKTLANVIQSNQAIRQLKVSMERYWSCVKFEEVEQLVREHPIMSVVVLENYKFTAETAMVMLRQLNGLKVLKFQIKDLRELEAFVGQLDEQWKCRWALPSHSSNGCIVEVIKQQ